MPSKSFILVPETITPEFCKDSYDLVREVVEAIPESQLIPYNMNATSVAATVFAAAPKIAAYEAKIRKHSPTVSMEAIYDVVLIAAALVHADIEYLTAARPKRAFVERVERAVTLRSDMYVSASVLVKLGVLSADELEDYDGSPAYKSMAKDLQILAKVYRTRWADIAGRSMTSEADLDEARVLAIELMRGIGEREQASERTTATTIARERVFTHLTKVYGTARAAIEFICQLEGEGDVDEIAPSIYSGRKPGKAKAEEGVVAKAAPAAAVPAPVVLAPDDDPFMP